MIIWIIESTVALIWMFVFPQNSYWKFNTQCDGIRKWGHGRVLRSWGWRLIGSMVLCSFKWDPTGFHSPFLHERTQAAYVMEEGPHPTMLAVWSRVSSFHTCEKYIPIVYKLITGGSVVKNTPAMWRCRRHGFGPRVGKSLWRRKWQPAPVVLPEKFHGQKNLVCYRPWVQRAERDRAHTHGVCGVRDGGIQSLCAQTFAGDNKGYKASLLQDN